ncbi:MAG: hypothetical protein RLZZ165_1261 [Bacteroidota bacterium]
MTPRSDLFDLIQSLTEKEIKAFRTEITKRKGDHVYLKLFDAFLATEHFDEEKAKAQFEGTKTINNFSIAKINLYDRLLEILCTLSHYQSIETDFDRYRQQIGILVKKSLHRQAMARINKALKLAEKLEAYRKIVDLHDIQREIARNYLQPEEYLDLLRTLRNKEAWLKEVEINLQRYRELFDTASIAQKMPPEIRMTIVNSILSQQLMQNEAECRSLTAKLYFFRTWNHLYSIQGRDTGWKFFAQRIIEILEKNDVLMADPGKLLVYINTITELGLHCIAFNEYAPAMEAAEKLKTIRKNLKTGDSEAMIFSRYWKLQLVYAQKRLDEKSGMHAVEAIKEGLRRFKGKLSKTDMMELQHITGAFLLTANRASEAIPWIRSLRDAKLESSRPDLHYYAWVLFLLAHYSLGHLDVVDQQLPGTVHYLREHKALTPYLRLLLGFFKKAVGIRNRTEEIALLEKTRRELHAMLEASKDFSVLELFDIMDWFSAKIAGIAMTKLPRTVSGT